MSKRDKIFNSRFEHGDFSNLSRVENSMKPPDTGYKDSDLIDKPIPKYRKVERVPIPEESIFEQFESMLHSKAEVYYKSSLKNENGFIKLITESEIYQNCKFYELISCIR